jgi:hypothetical protein
LPVERHHRQQLDMRYPQLFEIGDFLDQARERPRMLHPARGMTGEAAEQLVDDRIVEPAGSNRVGSSPAF